MKTHTKARIPKKPVASPFHYNYALHATCLQTLKMVVVGIILLPIRLLVFFIAFFNLWLTARLMLCCAPEGTEFPVSRPIGFFMIRIWAQIWLGALGAWWVRINRKPCSGGRDGVPEAETFGMAP